MTLPAAAQTPPESVYPPLESGPINGTGADSANDAGGARFDLAADYLTNYIWRGIERFDDPSEDDLDLQLRTRIQFDLGKLPHPYVELFVNIAQNDPVSSFQEVRPTVGFDWPVKPIIISAGHVNYIFPDRDELDTAEVFVQVTLDDSLAWPEQVVALRPYVYTAYDYDQWDGLYVEAGLRPTWRLENTGLSLTLDAHVGYVAGYRGLFASLDQAIGDSGFQHYQVGLIADYNLNALLNIPARFGQLGITGRLYYTDGLQNELASTNEIWGGAGIRFEY